MPHTHEPTTSVAEDDATVAAASRRHPGAVHTGQYLAAGASVLTAKAFAAAKNESDDPVFMSATKLARLIRQKQISAGEAVDAYIARQLQVNDRLNAVVMNAYERARKEARELDAKAVKGQFVGALHGVPMTLKDSLDTEGLVSTGATLGRQTYVPERDATVVARVRGQGAVLLGKTNTPEFTLGGLVGVNTSGNLVYGSSRNPYDTTRSTRGSSGGAGAIVAAGGSAFDIGSDWGGSIRSPAHVNGIAGIKPTSVRVPRTGHIVDYGGVFDLWQQLGPMCRRVEDLTLITPIISGPDFKDAACAPVPWRDPAQVNLKTLKVAYCVDNGGTGSARTDPATSATVLKSAKWLESAVQLVVEDTPTELFKRLSDARSSLISGDGWAFYQRLADKWGTHSISPRVKERIASVTPISSMAYIKAWEDQDLAKAELLRWMSHYDAFICPVAENPAELIDEGYASTDDGTSGWSYRGVFNSTGWPSVVVRCGSSSDSRLPIGIQVVANPWREDICLALATFLEAESGGWQPPPI